MSRELPDLLCLVGSVSPWQHEELRYSLRSACQHLPHRKLVVVGHAPPWLTGAETLWCADRWHMPVRNTLKKLELAVESGMLGDRFVLWNDDFYLLAPWDPDAPALAAGTLRQRIAAGGPCTPDHEQLLRETLRMLDAAELPEPLNHDVHRPLVMETAKVLAMLDRFGRASVRTVYAWRSAYAALHGIASGLAPNTKQRHRFHAPAPGTDVLSVDEAILSDPDFRQWCALRWMTACRYEG
jgi:hypothetical protein